MILSRTNNSLALTEINGVTGRKVVSCGHFWCTHSEPIFYGTFLNECYICSAPVEKAKLFSPVNPFLGHRLYNVAIHLTVRAQSTCLSLSLTPSLSLESTRALSLRALSSLSLSLIKARILSICFLYFL